MSRNDACYDRSPVGAQGDRKQQPTVTKTPSGGINPKGKILKKRTHEKTRLDEEEWNQRMQIWEKKRERLFGSEWDKSFREAVRARLKGKKPWRTSISCSTKLSQRKVDTEFTTPQKPENCQADINDSKKSNDDQDERNGVQSITTEEGKSNKISLDAVGLKRECSTMELYVIQSDGTDQAVLSGELREFKNLVLKSSDALKAKIKASEKEGEILLERTDSIVMAEPSSLTLSPTRFVKTVLSPIQSESECSKGAEATNSEETNTEMKNSEKESEGIASGDQGTQDRRPGVQPTHKDEPSMKKLLAEKSKLCLISSEPAGKNNLEALEMCETDQNKTVDLLPKNCNVRPKSTQDSIPPPEGPLETTSTGKAQTVPKPNPVVSNWKSSCLTTAKNDSLADRVTPEMAKRIKELLEKGKAQQPQQPPNEVKKQTMKTTQKDVKKIECIEAKPGSPPKTPKRSSSSNSREDCKPKAELMKVSSESNNGGKLQISLSRMEQKMNKENVFAYTALSVDPREDCKVSEELMKVTTQFTSGGKLQVSPSRMEQKTNKDSTYVFTAPSTDKNQKSDTKNVDVMGFDARTKSPIIRADENRIAVSNAMSRCSSKTALREMNPAPSITTITKGDDRQFSENAWNPGPERYITADISKERALHAIFSSPDTEIFGNRKKPPAQPVFIASVSFEDVSVETCSVPDVDTQLVFVECMPNELFELRARARPLSDESMLISSSEDSTRNPREWYREFHHPVIASSEEFEPEKKKSECFREIIIDRSGCRSFYDGTCHAEISKTPDKCHVRRYEVCHDMTMCSLKNPRSPSRREHCLENARTRHKTVSFDTC